MRRTHFSRTRPRSPVPSPSSGRVRGRPSCPASRRHLRLAGTIPAPAPDAAPAPRRGARRPRHSARRRSRRGGAGSGCARRRERPADRERRRDRRAARRGGPGRPPRDCWDRRRARRLHGGRGRRSPPGRLLRLAGLAGVPQPRARGRDIAAIGIVAVVGFNAGGTSAAGIGAGGTPAPSAAAGRAGPRHSCGRRPHGQGPGEPERRRLADGAR